MNKMIVILFLLFINSIVSTYIEDCLNSNNGTKLYLSNCMSHKDNQTNTKKIEEDKIYCCLLTITYTNKTDTYCMTTKGSKDTIEERIEMFKYQNNVKEVTINCSSNYLYITFLFLILIIF